MDEIEDNKPAVTWHIKPFDVEGIGIKNADEFYNGNISAYIRDLIKHDEINRQLQKMKNKKINRISILQIVSYLFISTDLLVVAIIFFSSSLLVMAITISSSGLLLLYSGISIMQKISEKKCLN